MLGYKFIYVFIFSKEFQRPINPEVSLLRFLCLVDINLVIINKLYNIITFSLSDVCLIAQVAALHQVSNPHEYSESYITVRLD